ncbi:MAG: hypothetical protein COW73_06000 [Nitrospirae bacterium CG18_big_fil_WC_8_21_14_2_50_70_55]|nr:hypothetical protein [Deltaproteobacteria bacterium]OIP63381.1 MAG: hypothetical protein AUK30_08565 [Nitrospirae bacterium CG2_30_70_394]PIQ05398.1 MAG: hypothetical protein COW73_06000 [Nitrospirae bacterium CG18_big_fil_WC_8_21_14_2_50_70_55]PIU80039.1 MAG: hypothetical protein COS73_01230 [Nitrospirae bacterium CG06_land_8_20_14_3_00_70_43]PIW83519.1 MAG: hypothetical protein COZ96_03065 [Nitrospirae bacterium CG_4_8_14_3_um_filter_70_85]PIX84306.1 MAG: hypothetical protein COZ33_00990 
MDISLGLYLPVASADFDGWVTRLGHEHKLRCEPLPHRPGGVVVSGTAEAIEAAVRRLRGDGVAVEPLAPRGAG